MGLLDKYRAKREERRKADNIRYINERTDIYTTDPLTTSLLYTSVASHETVEEDFDKNDNDAVDSYESESDRYSYVAPEYEAPVTEVYQPTYSSSYDSGGSSYSSSYDSGSSSSSSDSGSSYSSSE